MARIYADTENIRAYEKYLKGLEHIYRRTKEDSLIAQRLSEEAISTWNETIERNPDYLFAYMGLTAAYWVTGLEDRARQAAKHILRINPKFTVSYWEKRSPGRDKAFKEQVYGAFRKAGLPE
jgi:tetratricopeptide (TPR) repeat protein